MEIIFCLLLAVEAFSLQKAVKMLEEVAVGWQESRWIWRPRRTFRRVQPVSAAVPRVLGAAVPKNQALSADQRRLQAGVKGHWFDPWSGKIPHALVQLSP